MLRPHPVPLRPWQVPPRPPDPAEAVGPDRGLPQSQRDGQPVRLDRSSGHVPGWVGDRRHQTPGGALASHSNTTLEHPTGFWNREDVTRPFASQAVITDGRYFSFFCYQLNTVALSVETDANNPRKNLMWGTESLKLFESVQDGEVVGLDDDVLKLLVQFLMNQPLGPWSPGSISVTVWSVQSMKYAVIDEANYIIGWMLIEILHTQVQVYCLLLLLTADIHRHTSNILHSYSFYSKSL